MLIFDERMAKIYFLGRKHQGLEALLKAVNFFPVPERLNDDQVFFNGVNDPVGAWLAMPSLVQSPALN